LLLLKIRTPSKATLFPYTTLFRSELAEYQVDPNFVDEVYERIVNEGSKLKEEVDVLKQRIQSIDEIKNEIQSIKEKLKRLEQEKNKATELNQSAKLNYEKSASEFKTKLQNIPEDVRELSVLEKQLAEISSKISETEKAYQEAEEYYQQQKEKTTNQIAHEKHS